ncbi:hypothetical protein VSS92_27790, partial [Pseudomonas syringae pv. tagetis]
CWWWVCGWFLVWVLCLFWCFLGFVFCCGVFGGGAVWYEGVFGGLGCCVVVLVGVGCGVGWWSRCGRVGVGWCGG